MLRFVRLACFLQTPRGRPERPTAPRAGSVVPTHARSSRQGVCPKRAGDLASTFVLYRRRVSLFDRRAYAYGVIALACAAVVSPVLTAEPKDAFPLSTYPMFAFPQGRSAFFGQALGERRDGSRFILAPKYFGTDEVLQAEVKLLRAVREGGESADALCADLRDRLAADGRGDVARVIIRTVTVDSIDYFADAESATENADEITSCWTKEQADL